MSGHFLAFLMPLALLVSNDRSPPQIQVDVELVLAADNSSSMDEAEQRIQLDGYADAFRDGSLILTLLSGPTRRIAVLYLEWSSQPCVKIPWTLIEDAGDAQDFADAVMEQPVHCGGGGTNITDTLRFGAELLRTNDFNGARLIIDISGNGMNNSRYPPDPVRDELVRRGVTINGLPLELTDGQADDPRSEHVAAHYEQHVIGGPGSFVMSVNNIADFGKALKIKLYREIAQHGVAVERYGKMGELEP